MKTITLSQFLTDEQIDHAIRLFEEDGIDSRRKIQTEVIEPNMAVINEKIGQENDAGYLAFAVVHMLMQAAIEQGTN
jgi:hypothetical protein